MDKQTYFIEKLNFYLSKKGVSKSALAKELDCIPELIEQWLEGKRKPDEETIKKISLFFGVDESEFILKNEANETSEHKTKKTKRQVLGNCVRCGKPIYQGDVFGKGESKKIIKSELFKNPVEETIYIYEKGGEGYEYFCEGCCDYLLLQNKLEEQKESRDRLAFLGKVGRRSRLIGFNAFLLSLFAVLMFAFDLFGLFSWELTGNQKLLLLCSPFLIGYFLFSLMYVALSGKTWAYKVLGKCAGALYGSMVGNALSSKNEILMNGIVRATIVIVASLFCTALYIPICVFVGVFSMFIWPLSRKGNEEEVDALRNELYK